MTANINTSKEDAGHVSGSVGFTIFKEVAIEDSGGFAEYMKMSHGKFNELLNIIGPSVQKKDTVMRNSIPPGECLALTLRYLATGESFQSLSFQFPIGRKTIGEIVMEVYTVILDTLKEKISQNTKQ